MGRPDGPLRIGWLVPVVIAAFSHGCAEPTPDHPWIDLGPDSPHAILEYSGADAGQVVIAMDPLVSREEALELGQRIQAQAPAGAVVNVRLYNDEATARNWRTAAAEMHVAHLLVAVTTSSTTGEPEVRWVRPDSLDATGATPEVDAPAGDSTAPSAGVPNDSV